MDDQLADLFQRAVRVLLLGGIPALAIMLPGLIVSLVQGLMAVREESTAYAARAVGAVGIVALFGAAVAAALVELMRFALA